MAVAVAGRSAAWRARSDGRGDSAQGLGNAVRAIADLKIALYLRTARYVRPAIFAQVSFSVTVRLKTGAPGRESASTQKYP